MKRQLFALQRQPFSHRLSHPPGKGSSGGEQLLHGGRFCFIAIDGQEFRRDAKERHGRSTGIAKLFDLIVSDIEVG
ncbi:hypothetical protein [Roseibium marinum]|uniref:hypothetical protein n=1 Tax=Roseibium marinum TaxID=281252 RepID=UPI0011AF94CD|nr:hypothetical protein [Roseibium marinum]